MTLFILAHWECKASGHSGGSWKEVVGLGWVMVHALQVVGRAKCGWCG